jgi:hypothetical protein
MSLIKGKEQDLAPVVDLIPSLRTFVEAGGLRAEDLSVGFAQPTQQAPPLPRTIVVLSDGEKDGTWDVPSLREMFRGDVVPPSMEKFPAEYTPYFYFVEKHVVGLCHAMGDRTDQQMEAAYAMLRRRPDGRSVGTEHDFVWQVCALMLGMYPLSQAQFEAIVGRLEQSARSFAMRPVSRNYAHHLHHQFGCG